MLFIHQQIQSFLNLGACKEFPIMAKPRVPRKGKQPDVKDTAAFTNTPLVSEVKIEQKEVDVVAASATEIGYQSPTNPEPKRTEAKKATRRPEIVKTEPRANLLPMNLEEEVRRLAYLFSERRGFESGHETEDWLNAEREVRQRYHQHSA
jgi:hypothetical protein